MRRAPLIALALAGCNAVFGIHERELAEAGGEAGAGGKVPGSGGMDSGAAAVAGDGDASAPAGAGASAASPVQGGRSGAGPSGASGVDAGSEAGTGTRAGEAGASGGGGAPASAGGDQAGMGILCDSLPSGISPQLQLFNQLPPGWQGAVSTGCNDASLIHPIGEQSFNKPKRNCLCVSGEAVEIASGRPGYAWVEYSSTTHFARGRITLVGAERSLTLFLRKGEDIKYCRRLKELDDTEEGPQTIEFAASSFEKGECGSGGAMLGAEGLDIDSVALQVNSRTDEKTPFAFCVLGLEIFAEP